MSDSGRSPELAVSVSEHESSPPEPPSARPPRTRLFLVRHAQSTWNETDRVQGQADPPLSELGREQARRLADRLGRRRWAGFYTSDLKRAAQTAQPVAAVLEMQPVVMSELREIHLGAWEGLTKEEIVERYPGQWEQWTSEPNYDAVPGGEGAAAFEQRAAAVIAEIMSRHESGDVLVVTHGGVIQVALGQAVGRSSHG